ncbi:MAG: PAS domain-containing hybrid sensor histidine kinase/response regulator [Candidatus Anammoxibacter sp.]
MHRDAMETKDNEKDDFALLDSNPIGQFVIDKEFKVLFWNKCIENWTGIDRKQIVSANLFQHYPNLKSVKYINRIKMVFENTMPAVFSSLIHKHFIPLAIHGEELRTQHVTATCISGKERDEIYVLISIQDTSNLMNSIAKLNREIEIREKAEEAVQKSDRRFARMLEVSEDAIVSIDESQKIIIFNKSAERVFGYTAAEIMGKPIETIIPDRCRTNHKAKVEDFGRSETESARLNDRKYELFGRKKNGDEFPAEISISKFEEDGKIIFTAVVHDITRRKMLENESLKVQKLESVGVLAGGIAHDFNNILTAILGNTNLATILTKSGDRDKALEALSTVERASIRARDLTKQLLTFSRGGEPVKKTVCLTALVKESSSFALRGSNVKCEFSITETLWPVDVDEGQINQVINNIVINAAQSMPQGGTLKINAENITEIEKEHATSLKNQKQIKISFKDQGSGIKKEHLANIFDPYFTTKQTGSGLGLASSYSIIKNHNGLIIAESEPGVGSIFHVYLPASSKEVEKKKETEGQPLVGGGKILIMDDDDAIRDMGSQVLSFIGYEVECAEDGIKAIDMYKKAMDSGNPFDVVIMDLTIPGGMGGKEAIGKLHEIYPKAKAIVFSGYSNDPIMADYEKFGFKGVIGKPFELKAMNDVLQRVIEL